MQMAENELYRRMGNYELEEVATMNKDYQEELEKVKEPKKYYALLHKCNGEYYWVQCNNHIINDKQVPYKGFWLEKKDNHDDIKGLVTNNDELLELFSWLNINNKFAKELVAKLHNIVNNKTNEEDI